MGRQTCQMQLARWVAAEAALGPRLGASQSSQVGVGAAVGERWARGWREVDSWLGM